MPEIPKQLQNPAFRFVLVRAGEKAPFEKGWQKGGYPHNHKKLQAHIKLNGNMGLLTGQGVIVLDCDCQGAEDIARKLPETLVIGTSTTEDGYRKKHFYFACPLKRKLILNNTAGNHIGEVQALGQQVLIPPSIHPSGAHYEVLEDRPIAEISEDEFLKVVHPEQKPPISAKAITQGVPEGGRNDAALRLATFHRKAGAAEEEAMTLLEGWNARNDPPLPESELRSVVQSAYRSERPYSFFYKENPQGRRDAKPPKRLNVMSDKSLSEYVPPKQFWLLDGYISEKSFTFFAGKRSSCKTWAALAFALSLASGKPLFGSFETTKSDVLFIDEETGRDGLKERVEYIKKGMEIEEPLENLHYIVHSGMKLDRAGWREELEEQIEKYSPRVIIVDSLRRVLAGEENDATILNAFFTEVARPITEKYGCAWLFVHHLRKGMAGSKVRDFMDEMRGSSDFANYADSIVIFKRFSKSDNKFSFRHVKSRRAKEQLPYKIGMEWEENGGHTVAVSFVNEGASEEDLDQIDRCCTRVLAWMEEESLTTFRWKDAIDTMKAEGFSRATTERALSTLLGRSDLVKAGRGVYIRMTPQEPSRASEGNSKPSNPQTPPEGNEGNEKSKIKPIDDKPLKTLKVYNKEGLRGTGNKPLKTLTYIKFEGSEGNSAITGNLLMSLSNAEPQILKFCKKSPKSMQSIREFVKSLPNGSVFSHEKIETHVESMVKNGLLREDTPGRWQSL